MANTDIPVNPYAARPDFEGRQSTINTAYVTALSRLQAQQSQLYNSYGFKDGSTDLDPNDQFGLIQQLTHQTGQSLQADDNVERARGLNPDSGLGAHRAALIRYQSAGQANQLGQHFQTGLGDIGNSRVDATNTYNADTGTNNADVATYNSTESAYQQALAQYNQMLAASTPSAPPGPANLTNVNGRASTGTSYYAPIPTTKAKPGTVSKATVKRNAL